MLNLFTALTREQFLTRYWQRKPCVFRQALSDSRERVDAHELAGLACEEVVESRVIEGSAIHGPWRCRQGPFPDLDYASLGPENWTLLVQGVDQFDASVRGLLQAFDFLPRWRLEDVMASFAPRGGGVGPHFDYYDVFLLQDSGRRRWDIGTFCNDQTPLQAHPDLKLMEAFERQESCLLEAGDVLYLPAGLAHWGVSESDDCVTLSVGFRAPSDKELLGEAADLLVGALSDARRYRDVSASIDSDPYCLNTAAGDAAIELVRSIDPAVFDQAIREALGRLVTDTRHVSFADSVQSWDAGSVQTHVGDAEHAVLHQPHCRLAYSDWQLFVNGEAYAAERAFSRALCHGLVSGPLDTIEAQIVARLLSEDLITFV